MKQQKTAVALGLFDGVHLGHRQVLRTAYNQRQNGLVPCAFTFPAGTVSRKSGGYLYPTEQKLQILRAECGMEAVFCPEFEQVSGMDGITFAKDVLVGHLHAGCVVCGRDFHFGYRASCNAEDLQRFGEQFGFSVELTEDVCMDAESVSSSRIRQLLLDGEIESANHLLAVPYRIVQVVSHGAKLGRTIGFPTVNQYFAEGQLVPKFGVYVSQAKLPDGRCFPALTNIGRKPTVQYMGNPLAETYLDGFSEDLYGQILQVSLYGFLRPERTFPSVDALTAQMKSDLERCRAAWIVP